ncbi:hypothetical protein [Saccharothrix sp. HUAS TT1]|uniref:hypothetical protein n=1 Tax=unclassified Saccharothrix TaxID=2593673 RepID=UPI00345B8182
MIIGRDPDDRDRFALDRLLWNHRWDREAAREFGQGLLPFDGADGHLADPEPEFHGTSVGLRRHVEAGQDLCSPCRAWFDELAAGGYATGPTPADTAASDDPAGARPADEPKETGAP